MRRQMIVLALSMMTSALVLGAGVAFAQTIIGDAHDDRLVGTRQADSINGKGGNDSLYGKEGNDKLRGKEGNDTLRGGPGDDSLYGGPGNDRLHAGSGNDEVYGGAGNDVLYLKDGEVDEADCGPGNDTVASAESSPPFDEPTPLSEPNGNCEHRAQPMPEEEGA